MQSKVSSLAEQFKNPIVHMDKNGNGYCRIYEFWEEMRAKSYSSWEEYLEYERSLKSEVIEAEPSNNEVKKGAWTSVERRQLKDLIKRGYSWDEIAKQLNRTRPGVIRAATYMGLKSEVVA